MHAAADIKFSCTLCGQRMLVDPAAAGQSTTCPGCDAEIVVPSPFALHRHGYAEIESVEPQTETLIVEHDDGAAGSAQINGDYFVTPAGEMEEVHRQVRNAQEISERLEAANARLQAELVHQEAVQQALNDELASVRQRLHSAETQMGASNRELSLSRGTVAQLEGDLARAVAERDEIAGEQVSLEWKLTELEASLRNAEAECARMTVAAEELLEARSEITKLEWERDELRRECDQINRDLANTESGRELAALRAREKALEAEKQRTANALVDALADAERYEQLNSKARSELEEVHRRFIAAEKKAESLSTSEVGRDNEILRGILARQKEELQQRYRELLLARRAKFGLRLAYWLFAVGALAVLAFAMQIIAGLF